MTKSIEELLKVVTEEESVELKIFKNATLKTLRSYQESPTQANKKNHDSANEALSKKKEWLEQKYFAGGKMNHFSSLLEACSHLKKAGFKVSKSRIYRDKDKGLIAVNKDGTVPEAEARAYAATYLERANANLDDLNDIQADKADLERQKLREQIEKLKFSRERDQGKYVLKDEVDMRMVGILTVLDINFRQLMDMIMADLCHMMGGDIRKINNAKNFVERKLDFMMNKMAHTDSFSLDFMFDPDPDADDSITETDSDYSMDESGSDLEIEEA